MRLQKVFRLVLFVAFFLWAHFFSRSLMVGFGYSGVVCNSGGPFGVVFPQWLLLAIGGGLMVFLLIMWWKEQKVILEWFLIFIAAGGLGNFLERIIFGCVIDYGVLPYIPIFNIADIVLTIGVIGLIIKTTRRAT
jgi:signal peptidase II